MTVNTAAVPRASAMAPNAGATSPPTLTPSPSVTPEAVPGRDGR
jgi:hypothetical protein